ncbi:hypothetical protein WR25_13987 [Diploscapter pachys]|uniref:Uncharacterized protein n=1 Tax=Diploscapter pachys TaxID=2018661 RepID=A0A2A2M464_9BILA|nr:hypothetical protein WR25_13987 [Diploscapter pachys]
MSNASVLYVRCLFHENKRGTLVLGHGVGGYGSREDAKARRGFARGGAEDAEGLRLWQRRLFAAFCVTLAEACVFLGAGGAL